MKNQTDSVKTGNEARKKLKESEERYHKMIEEVQDYAILMLDTDGYILNWNKGAQNIKGYTEEEIIGKNFRIFYRENDRINQLPEKLISEATTSGRATHEGWRVRKGGTMFWGSIVITAIHDEQNNIIGFSKVTRDLTERKLAEDRMNSYLRDIEFRNKQLEEYAYIASHDLQEPLRKIQVFAELIEANIESPAMVQKNLEKINMSARRMASLIKDVLRYSQLSRSDELYESVDLNKLLEAIMEDYELMIAQKNVNVIFPEMPKIKGIHIQLHQLFSNLLSNAVKFSTGKNSVIEISWEKISGAAATTRFPDLNGHHDFTKILFRDNGVGFEQQYEDQVFKMFRRLSDNAGTGIGLALCKKIVENHQGHISVESTVGQGTTFTILLPSG